MKTRLFYDSGYFYEDIIFIVSIRFDAEYINTYVCMYAKKSLSFNNMSIISRIPNFILSNAEISRFTSSVCCVFAKKLVNLHRNSISIIFGIPELLFSDTEISGFMNSIYICMYAKRLYLHFNKTYIMFEIPKLLFSDPELWDTQTEITL